jgi:phage tail-like protein
MPTGERIDPFRAFNFAVYIDGQDVGGFSEVSGLSSDGDVADYREGTDAELTIRKLPGLRKYNPIKLMNGYTTDLYLWRWYAEISAGKRDRRDGTIALRNDEGKEVMRWHFEKAWINKIEGPTFKASGNEIAMQSVELVHEGLTVELAGT